MGLFSSIKKGLSKAWKGIKKTVKKVARGVKKVAKKVAHSIPGGKQLWKLGSKIGGAVMKGLGKITSALGPMGSMALSFVLAPVMGPALSSMWSSFGAGAASMAASANAVVSTLGSVGQGIFAAGNWIGGTLGAMGNALTEGASNIMSGNFSAAAKSFASNMSSALTGEAGMASVNAAAAQAAQASGTLLGQSLDPTAAVQAGVDPTFAQQLGTTTPAPEIPLGLGDAPITSIDSIAQQGASQFTPMSAEAIAQKAVTGKVGPMTLAETGAFIDYGAEGVKAIQPGAKAPTGSTGEVLNKAKDMVSSLLGGGAEMGGGMGFTLPSARSQPIQAAGSGQGSGSEGFSLLSGVQGLEESLRNSTRMMFG